jgi:cytidylate kinase
MTHISITGDLGSGKSAVARLLAERLGFPLISTGAIQRAIAAELHMTTLELNHYTETHPEIDDLIDNRIKDLAHATQPHIIDSRLAWFFLPHSFKVFLAVDPLVAAQRIFADPSRAQTEAYASPDDALQQLLERKRRENARFLAYYGADCSNPAHFDLLLNTSSLPPPRVAQLIVERFL